MLKPNILFIMADQLPAAFMGCYGSGINSTPTLDGLAGQGIRFDRCYSSVPLCAPNRATIFTGRSSQVHGVFSNNYKLQTDTPTVFKLLRRAGYRTGGFGKFHLTSMGGPLPEDFSYLGFDESIATEDPKLGSWIDWIKKEHPDDYETALAVTWPVDYCRKYGKDRENLYEQIKWAYDKILAPIRKQSPWPSAYPSPLRRELHQTAWITDISLDFMKRHLLNHGDKPFCTYVSYVDPHDPYDPPVPYDTMFKPDDMPAPLPSAWRQQGCETYEKSKHYLNFKAVENDDAAIRYGRALYHGSLRFIDDQIARIMSFLREKKLADNTIVIFTSDHGDLLGDHSLPGKGEKHFDKSIRCPLIVSGAGTCIGTSGDLVSSLDFFPTFCELVGLEHLPPLEGKSFAPIMRNERQASPWVEVTVDYCVENSGVRSIVTADNWRFTVFDEDNTGEMFDLVNDPDEQRNLFHNPAFIERKLHLYERLTRAYMHIGQVPQYRNLPEVDGVRHHLKPNTLGYPGEKISC